MTEWYVRLCLNKCTRVQSTPCFWVIFFKRIYVSEVNWHQVSIVKVVLSKKYCMRFSSNAKYPSQSPARQAQTRCRRLLLHELSELINVFVIFLWLDICSITKSDVFKDLYHFWFALLEFALESYQLEFPLLEVWRQWNQNVALELDGR